MKLQTLVDQIKKKQSFLSVGLDVDLAKIPPFLLDQEEPLFAFNKAIIDKTHQWAVAYKPNIAFYEAYGLAGWKALEKTIHYIREHYPDLFIIADAKRGDIGNTSMRYAKTFFEKLDCDALTIAPYMGKDSVEPFLGFKEKYPVLLGLTSNEGAADFQMQKVGEELLYKRVLKTALSWKNSENLMFVVGATKPEYFKSIRDIVPDNFLLVPGVGAQGGDLKEVCRYGLNANCGLLVNSSRGIIYASSNRDFAEAAGEKAKSLQIEMQGILKKTTIFQ